jgi:hypothetical protein
MNWRHDSSDFCTVIMNDDRKKQLEGKVAGSAVAGGMAGAGEDCGFNGRGTDGPASTD